MANTTVETLTLWDAGVKSWEAKDYHTALDSFNKIQPPSARILYNIGSAYLSTEAYNDAERALVEALQKDVYMSVGYFQLGCALFHLKRFRESLKKFEKSYSELRGKHVIDYTQLGLHYKLYACEVIHNIGVTHSHLKDLDTAKEYLVQAQKLKKETRHKQIDQTMESLRSGAPVKLMEIPEQYMFQPNKQLIKNMGKKDYLGKAVVKAAVDEEIARFSGFDGPRNRLNIPSPLPPRRFDDEKREGSPRLGILDRLKAINGGMRMPSPDLRKIQKSGSSSSSSSTDSSPSGTLEKPKKEPKMFVFPPKDTTRKKKTETIDSSEMKNNPSPTDPPRISGNFILKVPEMASVAQPNVLINVHKPEPVTVQPPRQKVQSGGFVLKGHGVIPPPPSRPPPKLKTEKDLPELPAEEKKQVPKQKPPTLPPKISPKPRKKTVRLILHCHTDEEITVAHGTKLTDILSQACSLFNMDLDTVDLWRKDDTNGELERIDDDTEMNETWNSVKDGSLELWCYGKP